MRRRSPPIINFRGSTRPSWAGGSHASCTTGSRAAAWVGRGSESAERAVPVPRNCAPSCVPPARPARCSAIEKRWRMSEAETLFATLRQSTGDDAVAMLERMVRDAPDHALSKINALDLAAKEGIGEDRLIAALLNAVGVGIFERSGNVMCPAGAG